MLYHGFLLTFFQDIFRNKLAGVLLVGLLYALSSDISSLNLFSFCLSFFYAVLYASIRTFAPGNARFFTHVRTIFIRILLGHLLIIQYKAFDTYCNFLEFMLILYQFQAILILLKGGR